MPDSDISEEVSRLYEEALHVHCAAAKRARKPWSLPRVLAIAYGGPFAKAGLLKLVHDLCAFVGPNVLKQLILFLKVRQIHLRVIGLVTSSNL